MTSLKQSAIKYKILYAEDDYVLRETNTELFELFFKEVVTAKDGKDALSIYDKSFDIVITDIQMPFLSGIELSQEILKIKKNQKIIIISAHSDENYFIELIKIGVSRFILKPMYSEQVDKVLGDICQELDSEIASLHYKKLDNSFIWNYALKKLYHLDDEVILTAYETDLLDLFLSNTGQIFTDLDIFNHLYYNDSDKEFSSDAIRSLIKRLRKKLPDNSIINQKKLGYTFKLTLE